MEINLLLIEDNPGDVRLVQKSLAEYEKIQFEWIVANRLKEALEHIRNATFDLILLDLSLPDSHGLGTFLQLQALVPHLPIVILTGTSDESLALEAVQKGAQDYLIKGQTPKDLLVRAIRYAMERHQLQQKLKRAQQQLVETERLRVLIETAGAAAHEINQPLTAIFGHIDLILTQSPHPPFREDLECVLEATRRIQEIVKRMGDIQHYQTKHYVGDIHIVDFNASSDTSK